jgi:ABC-type lipoprotein release transport system permease subunit
MTLQRPEMREGLIAYLTEQKELSFRILVKGGTTSLDDKFIMGRISALMDFLDMPGAIERNIKLRDEAKKRPTPQGEAGY